MSTVYRVLATHNYNVSQWWNAGMGNTDTLHPNSCFCSFSIPTSRIKFLLLIYIETEVSCIASVGLAQAQPNNCCACAVTRQAAEQRSSTNCTAE